MQAFDTSRLRITVNGEAITPRFFAQVPCGPHRRSLMAELSRQTLSLPTPLVMHGRRLPKRRRDSRGRLRSMIRDRRLLTMTGVRMSGGVDQPMRIVAECVKRQRPSKSGYEWYEKELKAWPGWGPGIVDTMVGVVNRSNITTATGSDLDNIGEMVGLPRRDGAKSGDL